MHSKILSVAVSTATAFTFACGSGAGHAPSPSSENGAVEFSAAPSGAEREELTLDSFDLEPGGEVYKCENFANPFGRDVALLQTQSIMSQGSHHLAVFRVSDTGNGALEDCSGLEFHATVHAAQTPVARMQFPDGVGAFLAGTEGIRLNAHYINLGNTTIHANVRVALDWVDASAVPVTAAQIYLNDSTLDIPPGKGSGGGTLTLPAGVTGVKLLSAQSHMHRRGVAFTSSLADGTALYETDTWSEPPVKRYDPAVSLPDGGAINWHCDFVNETAQNLTFGESAGTNEMCVFTGFYYPAPGGQTIVGDVAFGGTSLTK